VDFEFEGLLLELLSDFQVSIPELGTIVAKRRPLVALTSNNTRELSEALKRRCLYLFLDYPSVEREKAIVLSQVPELSETLATQIVRIVRSIRALELKKAPSISETLDWARTLLHLGLTDLDAGVARETLSVLLKFNADLEKVAAHLKLPPRPDLN
jgi:MoxR-like ATPase